MQNESVSETSFRQCAIVFALNEWFSPQSVKTRELYQFRAWNADLELLMGGASLAKVRVRIGTKRCNSLSQLLRVRGRFFSLFCTYVSNYFMQLFFFIYNIAVWVCFQGVHMWAESVKSQNCTL